MDCPVCKSPMIVFELDEVETDYCPECQGIWLDAGELEILFQDAEKARHLIDKFQPVGTDEAHRPCPICRKTMQKIQLGQNGKTVLIDRCPKFHGLWFDRGELLDALSLGNFDPDGKIATLLRQMYPPQVDKN